MYRPTGSAHACNGHAQFKLCLESAQNSFQTKQAQPRRHDRLLTVSESDLAHFCGDKNSVLTKNHQDDSDFVCINKKVANTDHDRSVRLFRCEAADGKR